MNSINVLDWGYIVDYYKTLNYREFENEELEKIDLECLFKKLVEILTEQEKTALNLYFQGYNQYEIGKNLGVNQPRVSLIFTSIERKLRTLTNE